MKDALTLLREHAESRKKMTKTELLADAELGDEAYVDMATEKDMAEAYYLDLITHLAAIHDCDLSDMRNES